MGNKCCEGCGTRYGEPCWVCGKVLCIVCYALPGHLQKETGYAQPVAGNAEEQRLPPNALPKV